MVGILTIFVKLYGLFKVLQALHMYSLGVHNLIIKVDVHYIKGMFQNPDIKPSTSMKHWIMAILMLHSNLVHVKSTFHGPDRLPQQPLHPSNPVPDNSNNNIFEDLVDCMHGLVHAIQLPVPLLHISASNRCLLLLVAYAPLPLLLLVSLLSNNPTNDASNLDDSLHHAYPLSIVMGDVQTYNTMPHSAKAVAEDQHFLLVHQWLQDLKCPKHLSSTDYATLVCYTTTIFLADSKLWLWLEKVTVHKSAPHYAATEMHSLFLADTLEAAYLYPPPNLVLSSTNLIVRCAINLQQ
ncbi:hypothetical protein J132_03928 [Termitomyces sp. J132]|nr:hypothetical protein J132_03928 [Termitomyces sp. J132]